MGRGGSGMRGRGEYVSRGGSDSIRGSFRGILTKRT
jgi:hypothetical protein